MTVAQLATLFQAVLVGVLFRWTDVSSPLQRPRACDMLRETTCSSGSSDRVQDALVELMVPSDKSARAFGSMPSDCETPTLSARSPKGERSSNPVFSFKDDAARRRTEVLMDAAEKQMATSSSSAGPGTSTSDGGLERQPSLPVDQAAAKEQQQQQDMQDILYSSAPTTMRPMLWRLALATESGSMMSTKSLQNIKMAEEEGPTSPRPAAEEEAASIGDSQRTNMQEGTSTSSINLLASSGMGKLSTTPYTILGAASPTSHLRPSTHPAMSPQHAAAAAAAAAAEPVQSFLAYLQAEIRAVETLPVGDNLWGQTERDRVYNYLLYVPYQLERLILFGMLLCIDSFLGVMTLMPVRCLFALLQLLQGASPSPKLAQRKAFSLGGGQLFDLLCLLILAAVTLCLRMVRPGWLYYWLKDITNEFLKMSVLSTLFEIADKILGNFGVKVMEALSGTCTLWVSGRLRLHHLLCDTLVAFIFVLLHAMTLMCQGLVLAVALNSNRNGLLALLIAGYFAEIKGVVFKRWDVERIRALAWQDVVERFHLISILVFVLVEDMGSSATWAPSASILRESAWILGAEVVIDVVKHAVLGKFNDVRPGIYREYMKDLCDKVCTSQSHNLHKLLEFHHLPCCALFLRTVVTLFWLKMDVATSAQVCARVMLALLIWLLSLVLKAGFGYAVKMVAHHFITYSSVKPLLRASSGRLPGARDAAPKRAEPAAASKKEIGQALKEE